jgi:hypothetical protein
VFLVAGSYTCDTDEYECSYLAPYQVPVKIDELPLDTVMQIADDTTPKVQHPWIYSILKELNEY